MEENKLFCIDSNVIIYSAVKSNGNLRKWLRDHRLVISVISKIEVLGFHKITPAEVQATETFFQFCKVIPLSPEITMQSIELRQQKSMSLGDSIIGATAISEDIPLLTANIKDFQHIKELRLIDLNEIQDGT